MRMNRVSNGRWFELIPGWMPICAAILSGAMWVARYTQKVDDHLDRLDDRMSSVEQYMRAGVKPINNAIFTPGVVATR